MIYKCTVPTHFFFSKWTDVTVEERKVFIAMLLYMSLIKMPKYHLYWSRHHLISLTSFTSLMPRNRFLNIMAFLQTNDNKDQPPHNDPAHDAGFKINKIAAMLVAKWQHFYNPSPDMSVDETLITRKDQSTISTSQASLTSGGLRM